MSKILNDERKIHKLYFQDESYVLSTESTEIRPYVENGEMAPVIWFEVIINGVVVRRINSKYILEIEY